MSESTNPEAQVLHLTESMTNCVLFESCTQFMSQSTNPDPQVLHLTELMTKYCVLFESCGQIIRAIPNKCHKSQVYKEVVKNWQHRSEFYRPSRGNEAARARFFAAVDKICKTESRALDMYVLISSLPQCLSNSVPKLLSDYFCVFSCNSGHC